MAGAARDWLQREVRAEPQWCELFIRFATRRERDYRLPPDFDVDVTLAYATEANLTGQPVYRNAECWLHREAADKLAVAIALARPIPESPPVISALRPASRPEPR